MIGPDGPVDIERLPFDLLVLLIKLRDRVVTRSELIDKIWHGRSVSEATISTAVKQATKAIQDNGRDQAAIRTLQGRGYRFVTDVQEVVRPHSVAISETEGAPVQMPAELSQPSIAALRFRSRQMDPDTTWFASAVPNELLAGLSRTRWLHVVSRASSFQFDPESYDPAHVGARRDARYLLSGLVEMVDQSDQLVAVTVELATSHNAQILWSERLVADLEDIRKTRQTIVGAIISAPELEVAALEARRSRRLKPNELDAWSYFHLGLAHRSRDFAIVANDRKAGCNSSISTGW